MLLKTVLGCGVWESSSSVSPLCDCKYAWIRVPVLEDTICNRNNHKIQISVNRKSTTLYLCTFINILSFEVHNKNEWMLSHFTEEGS